MSRRRAAGAEAGAGYLPWPAFRDGSPVGTEMRAAMIDLHWYHHHATPVQAVKELARFALYAARRLRGRCARVGAADLLMAVDAPGVGGVQTLLPLLRTAPPQVRLVLAGTNFVDAALRQACADNPRATVVNADALRERAPADRAWWRDAWALVRARPNLWPALPAFLLRRQGYVAAARRLLAQSRPRALVVFNERMLLSAAFSAAARAAGVPVIAVQHGNLVDNYLPIMADRYLTWGTYHSDWIAARSDCVVTAIGAPRLDALRPAPRGEWALPETKPLRLVFFSQLGSASVPSQWIARLRREVLWLAAQPGFDVVVKLHPLDTRERWINEDAAAARLTFVDGRIDVPEALREADVAVSFYSTVLAEALLHDLPVVQLNPYPASVAGFPDADGIASVPSAAALIERVSDWRRRPEELMRLRAHQRVLAEGYFRGVGGACHRFWQAVLDPLQTSSPADETPARILGASFGPMGANAGGAPAEAAR